MRIGFVWGILAGAAVVAALGWVLLALTEPSTPSQSAVVEQPSGRVVVAEATSPALAAEPAQEPAGAPAATVDGQAASATAPVAEDAAAGSSAAPVPSGGEADFTDAAAGDPPAEPTAQATRTGTGAAEGGTETREALAPDGLQPGRPEQMAALTPAAPTAPAGSLSAPGQATAPAAVPTPRLPADPLAPSFDVVRVDASGQTVIAGRAQPEQDVEVLLDGRVVDTVRADASGRFVAVIAADLSGEARQLQLRVTMPKGDPADGAQPDASQAGTTGGAPQQAEGTAGQPDSEKTGTTPDTPAAELATGGKAAAAEGPAGAAAPEGSAPGTASAGAAPGTASAGAAPGSTPDTMSGTSGAAPDAAASLPVAPAPPPELALLVPGSGTAQEVVPPPAPTADGAAPRIAVPDQPLPDGSGGSAPSADGLRVPARPGAAAGAVPSGGTMAGAAASPGTTSTTRPGTPTAGAPGAGIPAAVAPESAAAGATQDGAGGNVPGTAGIGDAADGSSASGRAGEASGGVTGGGVAGGVTTDTAVGSPAPAGTGVTPAESGTATLADTGTGDTGRGSAATGGGVTGDSAAAAGAASGPAQGADVALSDAAPSVGSQAPSLPFAGAAPDQDRVSIAAAPAAPSASASPGGAPAGLSGGGAAAPPGPSAGPAPAVPSAPTPGPEGDGRYLLSAPVLILPAARADEAPALVQPKSDELALLQPGGDAAGAASSGVVLHQITYAGDGDVQMRGSARPRHAVRVYGDGQILGTAPVQDGTWQVSLPRNRVQGLSLLRVDEIGPTGQVTSRVEAPFRYAAGRPLMLRDREVVIQKGDNLWTIAEHYYGEGIRYSLIYGANSELIRDPDLIYPDQVFSIPELVEAQ